MKTRFYHCLSYSSNLLTAVKSTLVLIPFLLYQRSVQLFWLKVFLYFHSFCHIYAKLPAACLIDLQLNIFSTVKNTCSVCVCVCLFTTSLSNITNAVQTVLCSSQSDRLLQRKDKEFFVLVHK